MADEPTTLVCERCGKIKGADNFFKMKDKTRMPICKPCLTNFIDNTNPETYLWILERFDVPYIEQQWIKDYNAVKAKKGKVGSGDVLGRYLRTVMNIQQYKESCYAESDYWNDRFKKEKEEAMRRLAEQRGDDGVDTVMRLQELLDTGQISQAEFNTLCPTVENNAWGETKFMMDGVDDDNAVLEQLTNEDVQYLRKKWGDYSPRQWVRMEDTYNKYAAEYEITVDREETLRQICKVLLKMDEALDVGDMNAYKTLSAAYDSLRKSTRFTEQQRKEDNGRYLDSIGELVLLCEQEGGPIKNIPWPDDTPQDSIDFAIKDLKAYMYSVMVNELSLGNLIEGYIKKLEESEKGEGSGALDDNFVLSKADEERMQAEYDEEKAQFEYIEHLEDQVLAEALELTGGGM